MRKISELDSLLHEYRMINHISSNVFNETLVHNTDFHCWLANIVIDTINYEKILLDILKYEFENVEIDNIAEINSRPILSISEKITNSFAPTMNYNCYLNELGELDKYQSYKGALLKDIENIDLLITQSTQFEDSKKQRDKLIMMKDFINEWNLPFIIGCYGNSNNINFQNKVDVLFDFKNYLNDNVKIYNETYNGIECKFLINKQKVKSI